MSLILLSPSRLLSFVAILILAIFFGPSIRAEHSKTRVVVLKPKTYDLMPIEGVKYQLLLPIADMTGCCTKISLSYLSDSCALLDEFISRTRLRERGYAIVCDACVNTKTRLAYIWCGRGNRQEILFVVNLDKKRVWIARHGMKCR